jgi:POT family proton-dependent oligopeptide transporter
MAVYVMAIPGGWLADRFIGQKKAVMLGGILLCIGHGILAVDSLWAFYLGMILIVCGVGSLKPNISTMVGGLYKEGDSRRDMGFSIFYIGINVGALLSAIFVGWIGETIGWHYGFGLAGIGMVFGQLIFVLGQKHLAGIGDLSTPEKKANKKIRKPLTKTEKDRVKVLLLSFMIIIVFWAAFEQAGGLMNLYTDQKIDRVFLGVEIPASVFQGLNSAYILLFAVPVAWAWRRYQKKGGESSSIFKMAVGTMIMGLGFLMMSGASLEAGEAGKASMYWLFGAYLLHTIGELCASPVALSFITKLAPAKYASLMMGAYFAATGLGNKVAGMLGEAAQKAGELMIFTGIFVGTTIFGFALLAFIRKLKALTHGAENEIDEDEPVPSEHSTGTIKTIEDTGSIRQVQGA